MLTIPINDISDISSDSTNDELNNDHCHVCLLPKSENFVLLHDQCVMQASVIHVQIIHSNSKLIAQFAGAKLMGY